MQTLFVPILKVLYIVLDLYSWAVIISVILSWLVNFNVVNRHNEFVRLIGRSVDQIVEPALARIRRVLPMFGALDLSPIVLILAIMLVKYYVELAIAHLS